MIWALVALGALSVTGGIVGLVRMLLHRATVRGYVEGLEDGGRMYEDACREAQQAQAPQVNAPTYYVVGKSKGWN